MKAIRQSGLQMYAARLNLSMYRFSYPDNPDKIIIKRFFRRMWNLDRKWLS